MPECAFCEILAGRAPVSMICEDADLAAFMTLRPIAPGECLVIPKVHVDHFTDLDDSLAGRIMVVALRLGRRVREVFKPERVGFVVHGYGVPHAHLVVVPLHGPDDITSGRYASIRDGRVIFTMQDIPLVSRSLLDEHARLLRTEELTNP